MTSLRISFLATIAAIGMTLAAMPANAAAISCPGARVFTVNTDPSSTCLGTGIGPLGGDADSLTKVQAFAGSPANLVLIDKSDNTTSGLLDGALQAVTGSLVSGLSGSFNIVAPGFDHLVLVFQSGIGNLDPDWAAFLLGDTDGSWSISGAQALSHASLFGVRSTTSVPEPITMGLLGVGLLGLGLAARRRRTS